LAFAEERGSQMLLTPFADILGVALLPGGADNLGVIREGEFALA
jgi:hypothetical protein